MRRVESVTRKHFGRRRVQLDVTHAPIVLVDSRSGLPREEEYSGAVVLLRERPPWCDAEEYSALLEAGALAVVREFRYFAPGRFYYMRDDDPRRNSANRRAALPWLDVSAGDWALLAAVLGALARSSVARTTVDIALVGLFLNYVGCGLEGTGGLGDYNLALDDGVHGCPTYEQVRQPSMDKFDVSKYQGRWYEIGFHDYTQFTEVYDTSLDIELNADGSRWLDDFGLKGPSPASSPRSV